MNPSALRRPIFSSFLALGLLVGASPAAAQTPNATPAYEVHCSDCSGTEYFGELAAADTAGCQDYQSNQYENWTAEGESSPDPKFVVAAQADIVRIDQATDSNFWYYRIVTRATDWSQVLLKNANVELAFGDCSLATTRFNLLLAYDVDAGNAGSTWDAEGAGKVKFYRDTDAGNNRIGDANNDGPAAPVGNTSNYDSNDDGYNADVVVAAGDTYARLHTVGANATIEFAIRRTAAPLTAVANPFSPCFGRAWTGQTSTIAKDQFAINDQRPSSDFSSTSWAIDSCNGAAEVDPCDPAPDCNAFDTDCGIASCDPGGAVGNCDLLTPRTAGTICRADAGECDVAETCDGINTGDCPADGFEAPGTACGDATDTICDGADTCDGNGTCQDNLEPGSTVCRADTGECDVAENCDGAGSCPADGFEAPGTACGDATDTVCDNPDTCDAGGSCQPNFESAASVCRADTGECDVAENCDGAGSCPADGFEAPGTACGDATDTVCDNPDSCDAGGSCQPNFESAASVCRADTGECDVAENCDGAGSCPADGFEAPGTACGDATDTICDGADTCDGGGTCQDNLEPGTTVCRADTGECDVAENCDGAGSCPADGFEAPGAACGDSTDSVCDNPDTCDAGGSCQPNYESAATVCRADAGECDVAENCDGAGSCPADSYEPADTACGNPGDTICDNPDSCDASGNCLVNNEPGSTVCRADAGECDVAENCDGAGSCPANTFEAPGTSCGDSSDTTCDNPDTCDAGGSCQPNYESAATLCRADTGECDVAENCDGAGSCPANAFEAPGTACGDSSDTICDDPDTCDAGGSCQPNYESAATLCRADTGECDVAENCDGAGSCPADGFETPGTACGSASDTICDDPDTCDAGGSCEPNYESAATLCRADAGECDVAENCDGAGSCPANGFEAPGTACGDPTDTICDGADTCNGSGSCQDNLEPGTTVCRADTGECDVAENCDGAGSCPANGFEAPGTACGSASDTICDNPDTCDAGGSCQPNHESAATLCRADAGECDVAENCDGSGSCPANGFESAGTACGSASDTICDNPDTCDSGGSCQPNNESAATLCRADAGECDVAENCDGAGACPANGFEAPGTACGDPSDTICDGADTCNGSGSCQDNLEPDTTVCRADAGECDVAETCDGAGSCPANVASPAGTPCGSASDTVCDDPDTCDGSGSCEPNHESAATLCRADAGECDVAENCDGAGSCPNNGFEPAGTACGSASDTVCDNPDTCNGSGSCQLNYESTATVCRTDAGDCDVAENCDGAGSCPANGFEPAGTACGSGSNTACDNPDTCNASGTCQQNFESAGALCRASLGECDPAETCTGSTGSCPPNVVDPAGTPCDSDSNSCTDDQCDASGDCDHVPNDDPCNDGLFCTTNDECTNGSCVGTPVVCDDAIDCTQDSCNESLNACEYAGDNSQCDDDDPCTADICTEAIGCVYDMVCGAHICRTAGYWSTHSGYVTSTAINVGQAVIDAVGGLDVCGQHIDATTNVSSPWLAGLGLSSAIEGLCVDVRKVSQRQLYRQLVATALNCGISGGGCDDTLQNYIDVSFTDCSDLCETGVQAPGGPSVTQCINELDCFNNGGQLIDGKCALGTCAVDDSRFCGGSYGNCPKISGQAQACEPFPGNCHSAPLCNEALGVCPKKTSTSSDKACREASKNGCTIDSCP